MDGVLLIDKPGGMTSADAVRRVKARVKPSRVGHLGTLDPFATGLLPILIGEATKIARFLEGSNKRYQGTIRLGTQTDTLDPTGKVVCEAPVAQLDTERLAVAAASFTGIIDQVPPAFSAIKVRGVPSYKLARRGQAINPLASRQIEIRELTLEIVDELNLRFNVLSSPGTYIRSLARDIGTTLGTVAHLVELRRIQGSGFSLDETHSLEEALYRLEQKDSYFLIGLREALRTMPELHVDIAVGARVCNGNAAALDGLTPENAELFKVICGGSLVAVVKAHSPATACIERVFLGHCQGDSAEFAGR